MVGNIGRGIKGVADAVSDVIGRVGKVFKKGKPSFWFTIQSIILAFYFPLYGNFIPTRVAE